MTNFNQIGGVGVLGYISPKNINDNYPVIDPLYGIDGLRNVETIQELNLIPNERRRAGMIVGVNGGQIYYRLKNVLWSGDINDWVEIDLVKENYVDKEIPIGIINGINKEFTLSKYPIVKSEHIFLNGMLQEEGFDYEINNTTITFFDPPISGMRLRCSYRSLE